MKTTDPRRAPGDIPRIARRTALALALAALAALAPAALAESPALSPELERVRDLLARYKDPVKAVHDGYHSTLGCVHYANGAMGVHFLNTSLISPKLDPAKPQILVYEPVGDKLELVAAEWLVPLSTGVKQRPTLFGRPFDGPMKGHEPLMPAALHHYDLHVWLFKENPRGVFAATNPRVSCANYGYSFLEKPTAIVAHRKTR
ncbi:MAG: hypothetical protein L6R19_27305 [Alphaproteobacteria bacterium]|nr:hypothetical protein [Alphaproteobacteria bacterium]